MIVICQLIQEVQDETASKSKELSNYSISKKADKGSKVLMFFILKIWIKTIVIHCCFNNNEKCFDHRRFIGDR